MQQVGEAGAGNGVTLGAGASGVPDSCLGSPLTQRCTRSHVPCSEANGRPGFSANTC